MKTRNRIALFLAFLVGTGCLNVLNAANSLTPSEKKDGWILLFDGKTLNGWRGYNDVPIEGAWTVQDGTLYLANPPEEGSHANLMTEGVFDDFDFRFDWKIEEGSNSGVMFRVGEGPAQPYLTGPEYQVLDNEGFRSSKGLPVGPVEHSASNYGLEPAVKDVTKPVGEWNEGRIVVKGDHVEYWLNGVRTAEYELNSDKWKKQVANSKFAKWKDFATLDKGHIALQEHGHHVWFRNLKIKRL